MWGAVLDGVDTGLHGLPRAVEDAGGVFGAGVPAVGCGLESSGVGHVCHKLGNLEAEGAVAGAILVLSGSADFDEACALGDLGVNGVTHLLGGVDGAHAGAGPGGWELDPLAGGCDARAGDGAGGDGPGEGNADAVGGTHVSSGGLAGHEGASGVVYGAFEEDVPVIGLLAHDSNAVLAAVAAEVLVTVEGAGHEGEVLSVYLLVVRAVEGGDIAFSNPGDDAVLHHHAGRGNGGGAGAVDEVNVANDEIHSGCLSSRFGG